MPERRKVSKEDAIQRAKKQFGEETIAKLRELPQDVREALFASKPEPRPEPRNLGGRPKGSGKDYSVAMRRMAELQEQEPGLSDREASRRVAEEFKATGFHFSPETIRTQYRTKKGGLRAAIREEQRRNHLPTPKIVSRSSASSPTHSNAGARNLLDIQNAFEGTVRELLAPSAALQEAMREQSRPLELVHRVMADHGYTAAINAENLMQGSAAFAALREVEKMKEEFQRSLESASDEARRGLDILLGRKPSK